jgi:hypothetical protein
MLCHPGFCSVWLEQNAARMLSSHSCLICLCRSLVVPCFCLVATHGICSQLQSRFQLVGICSSDVTVKIVPLRPQSVTSTWTATQMHSCWFSKELILASVYALADHTVH